MKINNFRGDLTDISAKKEALQCMSILHQQDAVQCYNHVESENRIVESFGLVAHVRHVLVIDTFWGVNNALSKPNSDKLNPTQYAWSANL